MMEETPGLCIDPEEDEIFFYGMNMEEMQLKVTPADEIVKLGTEKTSVLPGFCTDEDKQIPETAGLIIESAKDGDDVKNVVKVEHVPVANLRVNSSNMAVVAEGSLKICENFGEKASVLKNETNNQEQYGCNENEKRDVSTNVLVLKEKKREVNHEFSQNNINTLEDHNYSTPVKTVIDKSILKTPKSVVKADKDGGFLKVLSEIALVKAEADENTFNEASVFPNTSLKEGLSNDDNKENEKCDQQIIIGTLKPNEGTQVKLFEDSAVQKLNNESLSNQNSGNSEIQKENSLSVIASKNVNGCEPTVEEKTMENGEGKRTCESNHASDETGELCEMKIVPSCKENLDESNGFEIIFENLTSDVKKLVKEEKKMVDISDLINLDSSIDKPSREVDEVDEAPGKNPIDGDVRKEFQIKIIPEIKILDGSLPVENDERNCTSLHKNSITTEDERHKKFLRRRTMNLLQELSEIVIHEQVKRDSGDLINAGLSKEAAKVIEKLKAVGIDDSINSPDQYFDLDNLNETFLSSEVSDILNDTLSKPLGLLTNKDVEMLLEKINCTTLEDKFQSRTEMLDAEKENLCRIEVEETLNRNPEKINEKTPGNKFTSSGKFQRTPVPVKSNLYTLSTQHDTQKKFTPVNKCLFRNKKENQKPLGQSQAYQNTIRGCRTAEKPVTGCADTRIPKPTSTVSKIPVKGSQLRNRSPILNKTPYYKATKSLNFNNIKSPVQAYINAKAPVLISHVKAKVETGGNGWMKDGTVDTKTAKPHSETKIMENLQKSNLPFVNYKSAIPLKMEKSPESRLPRLAPKMQKLILGNSPVIAKHEGRIKLTTKNRPQMCMDESSIATNPSEVSVIVRKVALNSNIRK